MIVALILLGALVAVGLVLYLHDRAVTRITGRIPDEPVELEPECCGMHLTCERDSLSTAITDGVPVYYDDEELDIYKGREADSYTPAEIERFRDILLTMLPADIAGWARSLQLRGVEMPPEIRDELLLIVSEARLRVV